MEQLESKEYSWKYVTANEILSKMPCEFVYAKLQGKEAAGEAILYDGEDSQGKKIIKLDSGGLWNCDCSPPVPVYCHRGLYVGGTVTLDGVLVIWREIPQGIGYPK